METIRNVIRDIKPEYWVALGAAVSILSLLVAGFSLIYVRRAAKASREQTKQQSRPLRMPRSPWCGSIFAATTDRAKRYHWPANCDPCRRGTRSAAA
jgi:hypothetical protein